jgi:hypothetical protein
VARDQVALDVAVVEELAHVAHRRRRLLANASIWCSGTTTDGARRLGGEQRLRGAEDERGRHPHALAREPPDRGHRVVDERHLHHEVVGDARELAAVAVHVGRVDRGDAGVDRCLHHARELAQQFAVRRGVAGALGGEGGGGDDQAVGEAVVRGPAHVGDRGGSEEDLHRAAGTSAADGSEAGAASGAYSSAG